MDDFDNDMGLPDDEIAGGSEGDISDLGAGLDTEPDLVVETLPGGRSSGAVRARSAAPSAPKAAKPKAAAPKAAAKPKAKPKPKPRRPPGPSRRRSKPAKKSKRQGQGEGQGQGEESPGEEESRKAGKKK